MSTMVKRAAALCVFAAMVAAQNAGAFLDTGTLLTNAASATYTGGSQGTSVTYSATAKILVANPAMFLWKDVNPTYVAVAGGIVTYVLCFSNGGANSAFNFTITDKWPNNTSWAFVGNSSPYGAWATGGQAMNGTTASSLAGPWNPITGAAPIAPGTNAPMWIRWVVPMMGVGYSGCVTFALSIS